MQSAPFCRIFSSYSQLCLSHPGCLVWLSVMAPRAITDSQTRPSRWDLISFKIFIWIHMDIPANLTSNTHGRLNYIAHFIEMLKCGSGQVCNIELNDEGEQSHISSCSTSAFCKTTLKHGIWPDRACSGCYAGQIATKILVVSVGWILGMFICNKGWAMSAEFT